MASDSVFSGMGNEAQGEEPMSPRTILSSPAGMHAQLRGKQHEEERKSLGMAQMPRRTTSTIPKEHVEGWERTRKSIAQALSGIIPREQLIEHNIPAIGADGELDPIQPAPLRHAAVARLQSAADVLLGIWDALQNVDLNRLACLRLAERCANILYAIVQEIQEMGDEVPTEIWEHLEEFGQTMTQLRNFLAQYSQRPFLKRYLKRAEILRELEEYDSLLMDSLQKFSLSVQIAILKRNQTVEMALAGKTDRLVEHISGTSELGVERGAAVALPDTEGETVDVLPLLHKLQSTQNKLDFAADTADLRAILGDALTQNNDGEILRVLQLNRENLPDTIRTLQRALEGDDAPPAYTPGVAPPEYETSNLDRKFIEGVIDALRRVTKAGGSLPAWSITRNEVQRGEHIGSGSIAQVYKGTWHGGVVAIKSLSEATPRDLFLRAADMWMPLKHPNVLKLYGANVEIGSGRMFFVCPYTPFGALDSFLRRVAENEEAKNGREGELLRFMHETAQGMEYLHDKDVIHGDLKAANVLVDARMHCVVSDFGQTEMKSEVLRINNVPPLQKDQRWYAPELLLGSSHMNHETDIYSYAMCCVEILSYGQLPWGPILDKDVKELLLKGKRRPQIPYTRPALQELLRSCWDNDPAARPPFSKIVEDTETLCEVAGISLDYLEGPDPAPSSAVSPENSRRPLPPKPSKPVLFPPLTEERRPADSSMGLGLEPLGDAMLDSESNVTAEEVQIPHSSASPVSTRSHFPILYPPKLAERLSNDPSAVRCTDTVALNNQLPVGGLLFSVHSPDAALSWLEAHYEDPLLCALRERNFEGPIAISLSADECALAIFGSISDTLVPQMAKDLAQLSGFTVMVRSSADNPIPSFTSTSSPTTLSETVRDTVSTGRAVRLRGGAGDDDDEARTTPKWEGKYHNATVDLTLKMDDDVAYDVNVVSYIKFKTQSLTNSNPTIFQPRPEVISLVSLKVKLRRGETILDRSFSNLGFLVHRPSSIVSCDLI
ncbi:hypothetical protein DFH07DRAFT_73020 [Mycena maculata]|uniref:Protein kinase domain-containing protein n=1 Tax=Mycena maculata TaxID=230809 RepID=A0AAD7NUS9_9AGAR|nr:hypothetical protein DFH07DRAFT_73020 [Mycena maculata]